MFYLPPDSPELNLDERLNGDLKQAITRQEPTRSKSELKRRVIGHIRKLSQSPARVRL